MTDSSTCPLHLIPLMGQQQCLLLDYASASATQLHAVSTAAASMASVGAGTSHYLTRIVLVRALAVVHWVAFLIAYHQNKALIGDQGITPCRHVLQKARHRAMVARQQRQAWVATMYSDEAIQRRRHINGDSNNLCSVRKIWNHYWSDKLLLLVRRNPRYHRLREVLWDRADPMGRPLWTVLWLAATKGKSKENINNTTSTKDNGDYNFDHLNPWLDGVALTGMALSTLLAVLGAANVPIVLALWICQRSLMAVGGVWYGYGWEPQLAELSWHVLFLVPLLSLQQIPNTSVPSGIVLWTIRWYLFRIMMGAGLIKFRSNDAKWRNLTTMNYFYETQPVPSIATRFMHFLPATWHKFEVLVNHFVEVIAPFFLILPGLPRSVLRWAGLLQMQFQLTLIATGNLSFLNWLTMVPAIACLDDGFWARWFSPSTVAAAAAAAATASPSRIRNMLSWSFGGLVMWLSIPVIQNLLSKRQRMNASFDKLRLINSYGAFGVVSEERVEWIIQSAPAYSKTIANQDGQNNDDNGDIEDDEHEKEEDYDWREYVFKVKPGPVDRHPRWITPYHYRLDWQLWIAACSSSMDRSPWMYRFLIKLLERDKGVEQLLERDPWANDPQQQSPKYIKVDAYRYRFRRMGEKGPFWERQFLKQVYPPVHGVATLKALKKEVQRMEPQRPV